MLWLSILKMIAVLLGVLGLILLLAYLARRLGLARYRSHPDGSGVEILGIRSLGPRRQVVILRVGDGILLVGATDRNLTPLMEIRDPAESEKILKGFEKTLPSSFRGILRKFEAS
ncbi:MAG: flagellar biosynthetic protein FliO [Calditrichaeota bacterium]|nr:flagellar biosynthetic protein FliO [Calditrichota bacterium]